MQIRETESFLPRKIPNVWYYASRNFFPCSEEVELYSPQYHVSEVPKEVKVLVAWGEEDSPPFKSQGDEYHKVRGSQEFLHAPPQV